MMMKRFMSILGGLASLLAIFGPGTNSVLAENYPDKPIRIVVPMAPGGAVDLTARLYAQKLAEYLGQPVLVDNQAGGGGSFGPGIVAKAPPDGYTILFMSKSSMVTGLLHKLPYDIPKSFAPIIHTDSPRSIFAASTSLPAKTVKELIALAKSKPGQVTYASDGIGSSAHISLELFKMTEGIDLLHIPYKGQGPALIDMLAGRVDVKSSGMLSVLPYIRSGKLRALAVTGDKRTQAAPEIPTFSESGVVGWSGTWQGFLAPAGTPKQIVQRLNTEIRKVLNLPDIRSRLTNDGVEIIGSTPEEFNDFINKEKALWGKVVKDAGIRAQ